VELGARQVDRLHFEIGHLHALGIDLAVNLEPRPGVRGGDQLDDDLMTDQWFAAPVLGDEGGAA
jgi:hypothetical protein